MEEAIDRVNNWIALNDQGAPLDLAHLNLKQLPPIPISCQILYCWKNKLTFLPQLPNCIILSCSSNKLTSLPELPKCRSLYCYDNQLTCLPSLPCCITLWRFGNKYLYINKNLAKKYNIKETPNYNKCATIMQRNYKKYLRRKYQELVCNFLFVGPSRIVCLYSI